MNPVFFLNSVLLGAGLAMDAFSVSLANGLHEPEMSRGRAVRIAATFGVFQMAMPMIGRACVRAVSRSFAAFEQLIPWIAMILLVFIGAKMIFENMRAGGAKEQRPLRGATLLFMGLATSLDAFSVGFAIASQTLAQALAGSAIIGGVTFLICLCGIAIGNRIGAKFARRAPLVGGILLILVGINIFLGA